MIGKNARIPMQVVVSREPMSVVTAVLKDLTFRG